MTTVDANGNWTAPHTVWTSGAHDIYATQTNTSGAKSGHSDAFEFTVSIPFPAPVIISVTDDTGPITGPIPKNGTTDDNDPTIKGTGAAGDVVHVKDNGTEIGSATVDASGNWSFKPTTPLADGSHDLIVTQTDPKTGATSPASADWPFKIDTTTPVAPVIVSVNDAVGPVTGPVPKNGTTDDNDPTIKGTGTAGDVVHVKDNGTEIGTATVDASGNWSLKPATPLADGAHDITATQTNPATGKVGPASADWPFTVVSAPAAPSVDSVTDAAGPITGPVPKNGTTDDNDPTIAGKGVAGDVVHVKDNGTEIGSATVDANGNWSFKPTTPLADGSHDITATQTDPATGATSPASADWPFKIDTTAPAAPVIVSVNDAVGPITGPVPKNGTTDDNDPTIKGTGVAGDVVHVKDNGTEIGTTTVDASGNWSLKPATPLADGAHDITATQANPATGKLSPASADWPFTVNTAAGPGETVTITGMFDHSFANIPQGGSTDDVEPRVTGTLSSALLAGESLVLYRDGVKLTDTIFWETKTSWTYADSDVPVGTHTYTARVVSAAGNGAISNAFSFTEVVSIPAPVIVSVNDAIGDITGPVPKNGTTDDNAPTIKGTGVAGDVVHVKDNGTEIGSVTVDASGNWSFKPATPLANGSHDITTTQTDPVSGNTSPASADWPFKVDTTAPAAPVIVSVNDAVGPITGPVPKNGTTDDNDPTIKGTGVAGDVVHVKDNGTEIGTATVDASGNWSFKPATPLADGAHDITATQTNPATGKVSPASADWPFTVATTVAPAETVAITGMVDNALGTHLALANGGTTFDANPTVNGTVSTALQAGETLVVYRDGVKVGNATMNGKTWSFQDSNVPVGNHTYTADVVNGASHGTVSNAYSFTEISTVGQLMPVTIGDLGYYYLNIGDAMSSGRVGGIAIGAGGLGGLYNIDAPQAPWMVTLVSPGIYLVYANPQTWESLLAPQTDIYRKALASPLSYWDSSKKQSVLFDDGDMSRFFGKLGTWIPFDLGTFPTAGVSAVHQVATDDTAATHGLLGAAAAADPAATPATDGQAQHTAVGDHQSFTGTSGHDTVDLNMDPSAYFKESTAHIQGSTAHPVDAAGAAPAVNTLHLTGDHQILDLTSLTGKTAAAKISGIEVIDLGGHSNSLKLSLTDVLNLGEQDLFQKDGKQQLMVNGADGDTVDLSNAHIAGVADGQWHQEGTAQVGGVTYNVYEHSGAHTELLVQQGVQIALHN
ncbi:Ig-like domain-containing protein [Caballeronia sp. DA-9]|uniref:Ig-like domain-containing protein n=1 Tax=Caballeronia sp. DA-9 TaxID=3436237 RepID=UPI003F673884